MEEEEDHQCGDQQSTLPVRSEKYKYHGTRGSTDMNNLENRVADLSCNWRNNGNSQTTNTEQPDKYRYHPTGITSHRHGLPSSDFSSKWRSREDRHNAEPEQTEKQMYHSTRGSTDAKKFQRADLSSNWRVTDMSGSDNDNDGHIFSYVKNSQELIKKTWSQAPDHTSKTIIPRKSQQKNGSVFPNHSNFNKSERKKNNIVKTNGARMKKKLDIHELGEIAKLEPSEIIMKLAAPGSGLKDLVNEASMGPQLAENLLEVLSKAIGCMSNRQNLIHILSHVLNSLFLKQVLSSHILQYCNRLHDEEIQPVLDHTLILLTEVISIFPSNSFADVTIVKTVLAKTVEQVEANGKAISEETKKKLATLNHFLQHLQDKKQEGTLKSDNYIYIVGNKPLEEHENFRGLSVFPTHNDIYLEKKPHLLSNIVDGSYPDVESYLNTHFCLLREDFIRPLRDGISEYLTIQNNDDIADVRIYFDVSILSSYCVHSGIVHYVKFSTKYLQHITWESSQRLIYGALVCLSKDDFKEMLFATVADRSLDNLRQGVIALMFTEESREQLTLYADDDLQFVMAETTAYFEAYRHTLEGLKEMQEYNVPLQKYIVHCESTMSPPAYLLKEHSSYSLKKLIPDTTPSQMQTYKTINIKRDETTPQDFDVLDLNTWPTKEQLEFDSSQFEAFQKGLTSELAIIQGPPGTGKTYVGLKIVHALLNNGNVTGRSPILVLSYTNHALDQFLEGIYKVKRCEIVRVGSRSSSALMQSFSLSAMRRCYKKHNKAHLNMDYMDEYGDYMNFPRYLEDMDETLQDEANELMRDINFKREIFHTSYKTVLDEDILKNHIEDNGFRDLISKKEQLIRDGFMVGRSVLHHWLGISLLSCAKYDEREKHCPEKDKDAISKDKGEETIQVSKEPEIALFERQIDDDDISNELASVRATSLENKNKILGFVSTTAEETSEYRDNDGKWEITKERRKKLEHQMKYELQKKYYMNEKEYEHISNIWDTPVQKRWEIYRMWRHKVIQQVHLKIFEEENRYQVLINRLAELKNQLDSYILQQADIIGMTTTGAAKFRRVLQTVRPRIVVVEEAAEVLEANLITSLRSSCEHLILIGDHQQLRPSTTVYELAKNFNLEVSMFERLVKMGIPYVRLNYQHRMRPEIAKLLTPHIYDKLENHESVYEYDNIKGVCHNLFFVDHTHPEEHIKEGKSHQNVHEAAFVKSLCLYFLHQGYSPSQITVLTTYSGQLHCLQKMMPKSQFDDVRVCVVDKYQGEENDIIILSLVRSNLEGNVGFLKIPNRVCVALSRAKKGLFCIGNMQMLSKVPLWSKINAVLKENGQIGKELKVQCVNHPSNTSYMSTSKDFDNVPEGGCMVPCEYRLDCGHVCSLLCHPYDPEHKNFQCKKPCLKISCKEGHACTKACSEPCGKCKTLVPKKIPVCGHIQDIPCSEIPTKSHCKEPCIKTYSCGHHRSKLCGESCPEQCSENVSISLICGHTFRTTCYLKTCSFVKIKCTEMYEDFLTNNELFVGPCNICFQFNVENTWYADLLEPCQSEKKCITCTNCSEFNNRRLPHRCTCTSVLQARKTSVVNKWRGQLEMFIKKHKAVFEHVHTASQMMAEIKHMQMTIPQLILAGEKINLLFKIGVIKSKVRELPFDLTMLNVTTYTFNDYKNWQILMEYKNALNLDEAAVDTEQGDAADIMSVLYDEKGILDTDMLRDHLYRCHRGHTYTPRESTHDLTCPHCSTDGWNRIPFYAKLD